MEWKAVLSRNAFLLSKFLICMQSLFRITVLSPVSHIEILPRPFIEKVRERETYYLAAMQTFKLTVAFERIKIAIAQVCMIIKANIHHTVE